MRPTIGINMDMTADGWLRMSLPTDYVDTAVEVRPGIPECFPVA